MYVAIKCAEKQLRKLKKNFKYDGTMDCFKEIMLEYQISTYLFFHEKHGYQMEVCLNELGDVYRKEYSVGYTGTPIALSVLLYLREITENMLEYALENLTIEELYEETFTDNIYPDAHIGRIMHLLGFASDVADLYEQSNKETEGEVYDV